MKRITIVAAGALAVGIVLSGCGITDTDTGTQSTNAPSDTTGVTKGSGRKGG